MSEERFNRVESLLADLIKIVGTTNAGVSDLKSDVAGLKSDVAGLKSDVAELKDDMAVVKKEQELFRQELFAQSERIDNNHREVMARLDDMDWTHDMEIFRIKEKMAV